MEIETNKGSLESVMIARGQKEEEASHNDCEVHPDYTDDY